MRTLWNLALLASVLYAPFWCVLMIALIGLLYIPRWYEMVALCVLFDLLYRGTLPPSSPFFYSVPISAYAFMLLLCYEWVHTRIRERAS